MAKKKKKKKKKDEENGDEKDPRQLELEKAKRGEEFDPLKMPMMHLCVLCKDPIRKNHESYRKAMSAGFIANVRKDFPDFRAKMDICKECGEKYEKISPPLRRPPGHRV